MAENGTNWTPVVMMGLVYFILKDFFGDDDDDDEETEELEDLPLSNNPWAYSVFKLPPYKSNMYRMKINKYGVPIAAARIYKGIGYVYDDEAKIMSGVKLAGTKTDIAIIAKYFDTKYGFDVYEKLKKNLSKSELGRINRYVLALPNYSSTGTKR